MTCREVIALVAEYLERTLTERDLEALEEHLRDCAPCRAYLATYRKTRDVTAEAQRVAMPPEMQERLRRFLIDRFGGTP